MPKDKEDRSGSSGGGDDDDNMFITVMEASNMMQHLWRCRVINKDVQGGAVHSTERLHEFNEKSLLNWLHRKRYPLCYKVSVVILFSMFGSTLCYLC